MATLPDSHLDLLDRETFAALGTVMRDGTPHITPVWVDHDGDDVLVNTAAGRQKERNLRRTPRVGVMVYDPENPYRYLSVLGAVADITTEGAVEHIHDLSMRYTGEEYGDLDDEAGERVIVRVRPERVLTG
jgi:PPOX class probable F420-dependent enzyme